MRTCVQAFPELARGQLARQKQLAGHWLHCLLDADRPKVSFLLTQVRTRACMPLVQGVRDLGVCI